VSIRSPLILAGILTRSIELWLFSRLGKDEIKFLFAFSEIRVGDGGTGWEYAVHMPFCVTCHKEASYVRQTL